MDLDFKSQYNDLVMQLESDVNLSDDPDRDGPESNLSSDDLSSLSSDDESDQGDLEDSGIMYNFWIVFIQRSPADITADSRRPRKHGKHGHALSSL